MKTAMLLIGLLISLQAITAGSDPKTRNIRGKILNKETMQPVAEVSVTLSEGSLILGTISNENGDFRLWKIPDNCKSLVISHDGYQPKTITIECPKEPDQEQELVILLEAVGQNVKQMTMNERRDPPKR